MQINFMLVFINTIFPLLLVADAPMHVATCLLSFIIIKQIVSHI